MSLVRQKLDQANQIFQQNGINVSFVFNGNYDVVAPKTFDTYPYKDLFRRYGWRWDKSRGWTLDQKSVDLDPYGLVRLANAIANAVAPTNPTKQGSMSGTTSTGMKFNLDDDLNMDDDLSKYWPKDFTAKDKAYMYWRNDPTITTEELAEKSGAEQTKIRSYRKSWRKGERIPQLASWYVIGKLGDEIEELSKGGNNSPELKRQLEKVIQERNEFNEALTVAGQINKDLEEKVKNLEKRKPTTIILKRPGKKNKILKTARHPCYQDVLELTNQRKNILMTGPAGCGKSFLAEQIAKDLGLPFASINCSAGMSESHLLGRLIPIGSAGAFEFVPAPYWEMYKNGGVFCGDELDASDPNVMLCINTSLANGYLTVPNNPSEPQVPRHPDFVFIGCANTFGRGCDRMYVGRNQLDEATLDRFRIGTIEMDYDGALPPTETEYKEPNIPESFKAQMEMFDNLEKELCPDLELRTRLTWYRERVYEKQMERIVSTRFMIDAYDMKTEAGWSNERIDQALFSGWTEDEISMVKGPPNQ